MGPAAAAIDASAAEVVADRELKPPRRFFVVRAQTGVGANIVLSVSFVVAPGAVKSTDMSVPPE
jgi:hypothetical protein